MTSPGQTVRRHITEDELVALITAQVEAGLLSHTVLPGNAVYTPPPPTPRRIDNFNRTVPSGLGTPDKSQFAYTYGADGQSLFAVGQGGATGQQNNLSNLPGDYPYAGLVYGREDQDVTYSLGFTSATVGGGIAARLYFRGTHFTDNGSRFETQGVSIDASGNLSLLEFNTGGGGGGETADFSAVGPFPADGQQHTIRLQVVAATLRVAIDSTEDADLKTVSTSIPQAPQADNVSDQDPGLGLGVWAGFGLSPGCLLAHWDFNYPGVFDLFLNLNNLGQGGQSLPGKVALSGQAWRGDPSCQYANDTQAGTYGGLVLGGGFYRYAVVDADPTLKDGCGVKATVGSYSGGQYFGVALKEQGTVPFAVDANTPGPPTASGLLVKQDGLYYAAWGAWLPGSFYNQAEVTHKLVGWPDSSYNFQPGDECFVVFDGDTVEVRRNNVVSVTGFDYVAALTGLTFSAGDTTAHAPGQPNGTFAPSADEVAAIRASVAFGVSTGSTSGDVVGPFIVLP